MKVRSRDGLVELNQPPFSLLQRRDCPKEFSIKAGGHLSAGAPNTS